MRLLWIGIFGLIVALGAAAGWWLYQDSQRITTLTVAAGDRGSDSHRLLSEIAEVVERHSDRIRLRVVESDTASSGINLINRGEVDLATIQSNTPAYTNIQLVAELFADHYLLITRDDPTRGRLAPPLDKVTDLVGKRILIPQSGTVNNRSFWTMVDHYGVPPERIRTVALPRRRAMEQFIAGDGDSIFFLRSLRDPFLLAFIEEAGIRRIGLRFIPINQAPAMALKRPYLLPATIVRGAFDGSLPLPKESVEVPSLMRLLVAGAHVSEDAVAELVETVFSNRLDLLIRMPLSSRIADPRNEGRAALGLHPGAQRYYERNEPSFLQENAEPMALMVTLLAMLGSALLGLRRAVLARAKNRADTYNETLLEIAARARQCRDLEDLRKMREELGLTMEAVVRALDEDRVTDEGFQSFTLLWNSVRDTVNDRIRDVR
ncbi:MAG: TAXI family TRAP transporter solute-binding subunit [Pseudomonadota bacterium]